MEKEEIKLTKEQEEKLELIRKEFENNENLRNSLEVNSNTNNLIKEFHVKFLKNNLKNLTLESYVKIDKDYFLYWLEAKTNWTSIKNKNINLGNAKPGTMNLCGLYYSPKNNSYKFQKNIITKEEAEQIFEKQLKPFWIEVLNLIKSNNIRNIEKIKPKFFSARQFIIKFINLIKYDQYLLITKIDVLKKIAKEYNIKSNYNDVFELFQDVSNFFRKNLKEIDMKDISGYLWNKFGEKSNGKTKTYLEKYLEKHSFNCDYIDTVIKHSEFYNNLEEIYSEKCIKFGDTGFDFSGFNKSKSKDLYFLFITENDKYYYVGLTIITNKSGDSNKNPKYEFDWIDKSKIEINSRISDLNFISFDNDNDKFISKALAKYFNSEPPENNILKKKKQIILYGPPGTGKTYNTKNIIYNFLNNENDLLKNNDKSNIKNKYDELEKEGRVKFITFHQSFAYEEFIEGLKPKLDEENSNEIEYEISNGIFKEICETIILNYTSNLKEFYKLTKEERNDLLENSKPYFLIIDEINRGNISKIFGELITLLEKDKRLGEENELIANLPYSKEKFSIPPNLYIIATMNTSDKSIATLDIALRRRFGFIEMLPIDNLDEINKNCEGINLQNLLNRLNKRIEYLLDKDHTIGHSYFMEINTIKKLKEVFYNEIIPLLEEYFYGNYDKLKLVIGDLFFIKNINNDSYVKEIFGKEITDLVDDEIIFKLKDKKEIEFEEAINDLLNQNNQNSTESENK